MRRFALATPDFADPIAEMNITPLIDVLLVLIVMLILTIPIMANEVPMNLPSPAPAPTTERVTHRLEVLVGGATRLDGTLLDGAALAGRLKALAGDPQAALVLAADPQARYDPVVQTLASVKRAGVTRLGFEGNRAFSDQ